MADDMQFDFYDHYVPVPALIGLGQDVQSSLLREMMQEAIMPALQQAIFNHDPLIRQDGLVPLVSAGLILEWASAYSELPANHLKAEILEELMAALSNMPGQNADGKRQAAPPSVALAMVGLADVVGHFFNQEGEPSVVARREFMNLLAKRLGAAIGDGKVALWAPQESGYKLVWPVFDIAKLDMNCVFYKEELMAVTGGIVADLPPGADQVGMDVLRCFQQALDTATPRREDFLDNHLGLYNLSPRLPAP